MRRELREEQEFLLRQQGGDSVSVRTAPVLVDVGPVGTGEFCQPEKQEDDRENKKDDDDDDDKDDDDDREHKKVD